MFTTYGIFHPQSCICVYIGQTGNFDERSKAHRTAHRERKAKEGSIQYWLKQLHQAKLQPNIVALEVVQTERESLASEEKWVEIFTQIGHPLKNGWIEHKNIIEKSKPRASDKPSKLPAKLIAKQFPEGKRTKPIIRGYATLNGKKTGYRLNLLDEEATIDLLPPSDKDKDCDEQKPSISKKFKSKHE